MLIEASEDNLMLENLPLYQALIDKAAENAAMKIEEHIGERLSSLSSRVSRNEAFMGVDSGNGLKGRIDQLARTCEERGKTCPKAITEQVSIIDRKLSTFIASYETTVADRAEESRRNSRLINMLWLLFLTVISAVVIIIKSRG